MSHAAIGGAILFALALTLAAFPAMAAPPVVGETLLPTPRLVCTTAASFEIIFADERDPETIKIRVAVAKAIRVNGGQVCGLARFNKPTTVVSVKRVGGVDFANGTSSDAFAVGLRFDDGDEVFGLWFDEMPGEGI